MKKNHFFILTLLFVTTFPCFGLSYNITFTGSGESTILGDVLVKNLTTGNSITVPAGNILNLSDGQTAIAQLSVNDETIRVYPNSTEGTSTVTFFAKQAGNTQLNVFNIDGKKVAGIIVNLQAGSNTFKLSLPRGFYAIQATGNGYS
jgi:hypothetical protein